MAPIPARRRNGFCSGSLWKSHTSVTAPPNLGSLVSKKAQDENALETMAAALTGNARSKTHDYCVLVGDTLCSYTDVLSFSRGDHPTSEVRIVGASAWNPKLGKNSESKFMKSTSTASGPNSPSSSSLSLSTSVSSLASEVGTHTNYHSSGAVPSTGSPTFRILTHAGTHVYCIAPSASDRDIWLSALHSALESSFASMQEVFSSICAYNNPDGTTSTEPPLIPTGNQVKLTHQQQILTPPVPQKRTKVSFTRRLFATSTSTTMGSGVANSCFVDPYADMGEIPSKLPCLNCGRYPPESAMPAHSATPLPHYGMETRVNVCRPCLIAQGVLRHVLHMASVYATGAHERASLTQARDLAYKAVKKRTTDQSSLNSTDHSNAESITNSNDEIRVSTHSYNITIDTLNSDLEESPSSDNIEVQPEDATNALMKLIQSPKFQSFRRRSKALDIHCKSFENSTVKFVAEFLETLNEHAREASASSIALSSGEELRLKKEAFKISGDIGAALKSLRDAALPFKKYKPGVDAFEGPNSNCTEMIVCVLEYFLDLCEQGELASIAFFWPQLRQIHLQMLPPTDSGSLIRIELMEDFLLTVCVKYSVHLALELLWGCIADLEEGLMPSSTTSNACKRRRYSLLRFVCELESLIFDFDGGWGGGTVSLGAMLNPTNDQAMLIRDAMSTLQIHRRFSSHHLTRSVRLEKLQFEAEKDTMNSSLHSSELGTKNTLNVNQQNQTSMTVPWLKRKNIHTSDLEATKRKYLIARNADYFSTQIMFTRRLGDLAEKLRFLDVEKRSAALEEELNILNASGRMGGDPLNRLCLDHEGLVNALHIPSTEGHVFRSKERTPVLLLLEVVREENPFASKNMRRNEEKDDAKEDIEIEKNNTEGNDVFVDENKPEDLTNDTLIMEEAVSSPVIDQHLGEPKSTCNDQIKDDNDTFVKKDFTNEALISEQAVSPPETDKNLAEPKSTYTDEIKDDNDASDKENAQVSNQTLEMTDNCELADDSENKICAITVDRTEEGPCDDDVKVVVDSSDIKNEADQSQENNIVQSLDLDNDTKENLESATHLENSTDANDITSKDKNAIALTVDSHDLPNGDVSLIKNGEIMDNAKNASSEASLDRAKTDCVEKDLIDLTENLAVTTNEESVVIERPLEMDTDPNNSQKDMTNLESVEESSSTLDILSSPHKFPGVLPSPNKREVSECTSVVSVGDLVSNMMNAKINLPDLGNKLSSRNNKDSPSISAANENGQSNNEAREIEAGDKSEADKLGDIQKEQEDPSVKTESSLVSQPNQTPFGVFTSQMGQRALQSSALSASLSNLSAHGDGRREVLTAIMMKGMRSSNLIARGAAPVAQRAIQAMAYKKAQRMISDGVEVELKEKGETDLDTDTGSDESEEVFDPKSSFSASVTVEQSPMFDEGKNLNMNPPSEEDECMESLRLLLVQHRVAQGNMSPEKAARTLAPETSGTEVELPEIKKQSQKGAYDESVDAGEIDTRLSGCGRVSFAVLSALKLWRQGIISNHEVLELVQKDIQYTRIALPGAENENKLIEDSQFWGRFSFGERWNEKKARIQASSQHGSHKGWDLTGVIVKSNDDVRQEAFTMQLIELCREAFEMSDLELWVQPYTILATGRTTGIIEMVHNAMSFDSLKKRPGYSDGELLGHFKRMAEVAADPEEALLSSQKNFVRSLAAYSLMSYLFLFKDRHNGNLLLDTAGHVIHIDFGFVFGIAPGGSFSLEQSAPFKLTEEMIRLMGGVGSPLFTEFVTLFCCGFLALQAHVETFCTLVEITCDGCSFKCFEGKEPNEIVSKLRDRFCPQFDRETTIAYAMDLINQASTSYGTKQYDYFQYLSNGIAS